MLLPRPVATGGSGGATTPQEIGAIPTAEKGAANGVATLDSYGQVPAAQLPSAPTYTAEDVGAIPTAEKGAANGVATLGSDGKVMTSQLPASTGGGSGFESISEASGVVSVGDVVTDAAGILNVVHDGRHSPPAARDLVMDGINTGDAPQSLVFRRASITWIPPYDVASSPKSALAGGTTIGSVKWQGYGSGGYRSAAEVTCITDGVPGGGGAPADIVARLSPDASTAPIERLRLTSVGLLRPGADATQSLGSSDYRWDAVYAVNGVMTTSDARVKVDIRRAHPALTLAYARQLRAAVAAYRMQDIEAPAVTETRQVARQVMESVELEREVVTEIDGRWTRRVITEVVERPMFDEVDLYDEAGTLIGKHRIPVVESVEEVVVVKPAVSRHYYRDHLGLIAQDVKAINDQLGIDHGGYYYDAEADLHGVRMDEFVPALIAAIDELAARVEALEARQS